MSVYIGDKRVKPIISVNEEKSIEVDSDLNGNVMVSPIKGYNISDDNGNIVLERMD